jgi:glycosyltransferase involved in cell wall biosynthesis
MALGLPAILADIPVLKETAGDNAVYFDINNPGSFCEAVNSIRAGKYNLQKMAIAARLTIEGFAHKKQFLKRLNEIYKAT